MIFTRSIELNSTSTAYTILSINYVHYFLQKSFSKTHLFLAMAAYTEFQYFFSFSLTHPLYKMSDMEETRQISFVKNQHFSKAITNVKRKPNKLNKTRHNYLTVTMYHVNQFSMPSLIIFVAKVTCQHIDQETLILRRELGLEFFSPINLHTYNILVQ